MLYTVRAGHRLRNWRKVLSWANRCTEQGKPATRSGRRRGRALVTGGRRCDGVRHGAVPSATLMLNRSGS